VWLGQGSIGGSDDGLHTLLQALEEARVAILYAEWRRATQSAGLQTS